MVRRKRAQLHPGIRLYRAPHHHLGLLAHLVERRSCKPEVRGSSPRWSTWRAVTRRLNGMWPRGKARALGARDRRFESFHPDGSLVKSESRAVEAREVPGQFRGEPPIAAEPRREWLILTAWRWLGVRRRQRISGLWPEILASQAFSGDVPAFQAGERGSIPR